ncbi:hypothetical protein [Lactococcus garvieae]|uniref:hypothetical protein n=1 Tax=Lactococcus garvieae TaxID=1363 RepID=UPI0009BE20AB|nr:hypothetical protein [Lactococcus garvieae]
MEDTVFNGSYYYGIHVESGLVSPDNSDDFLPDGHDRLAEFLTGIRNNAMDGEGSNPRADMDSPPSAFNFDAMLPGRVFTMSGVEYRYLEQQGDNHLIIRNEAIRNTSFNDQANVLADFYDNLNPDVQAIVQPVTIPADVPSITDAQAAPWEGTRWLPAQWNDARFDAVRADRTSVSASGGTSQAFALSLADVVHLSTEEGPFPYHAARVGARASWWPLRTPASPSLAWHIGTGATLRGHLYGNATMEHISVNGGVRPALNINQPTN